MSLLTGETPRQADAYLEYLKLGIRRSYEELHLVLTDKWGDKEAPSVTTLAAWGQKLNWRNRTTNDDEMINRRMLDRLRDKLATENEKRRGVRLQISDIQLDAAMHALVEPEKDAITGEEYGKPRDLLQMDPSAIRAINDTIRLASETQRLDSGQATQRIATEEMSIGEEEARALGGGDALVDEVRRFIGFALDSNGALEVPDVQALPTPYDEPPLETGPPED